jgi:hypothetical protein
MDSYGLNSHIMAKALGRTDEATNDSIMGGDTKDSEFLWQCLEVEISFLTNRQTLFELSELNPIPTIKIKINIGLRMHCAIPGLQCSLQGKQLEGSPSEVHLPYGAVNVSTHTVSLDIPSLPTASRQAHIFPGLSQHSLSLLSVGHICDSGCAIAFTSDKVTVKHDTAPI